MPGTTHEESTHEIAISDRLRESTTKSLAIAGLLGDDDEAPESLLSRVDSLDDAFALFSDSGINVEESTEYLGGNEILNRDEKARLVGVPFFAMSWRFNEGDVGYFVSIEVITDKGEKYIVNDGSTGILLQLSRITKKRVASGHPNPTMGLLCRRGLRVSEYYLDVDNNISATPSETHNRKAATYYLA